MQQYAAAHSIYMQGLTISQQSNETDLIHLFNCLLAQVALTKNDNQNARELIEPRLNVLMENPLNTLVTEPDELLMCYQTLRANGESRLATQLLRKAQAWLHKIEVQIDDNDLRHSFLHNVVENRELMAATVSA